MILSLARVLTNIIPESDLCPYILVFETFSTKEYSDPMEILEEQQEKSLFFYDKEKQDEFRRLLREKFRRRIVVVVFRGRALELTSVLPRRRALGSCQRCHE